MELNYQQRRRHQALQTQRQILSAALSLMREKGFDKVTVRDICRQAGITTGAFYHHFPSKEALLVSGVGALDSYMERALLTHPDLPPMERLAFILTTYIDFIERESGELTGQYYMTRLSNSQAGFRLDPNRYVEQLMVECFQQAQTTGEFRDGWTPQWAASFCYRHFRGLVLDWVLAGYSYCLRDRMQEDFRALRAFAQALPPHGAAPLLPPEHPAAP